MSEQNMLIDILNQTLEAAQRVSKRFEPVTSVEFFTDSAAGMEKLDAICMLLIAIGESLKKVDKITDRTLLVNYPQVDCSWRQRQSMRMQPIKSTM